MNTGCEKDFLDIISILSIPVIAVIAAYIALQQWKVNERRLKHELFDRNFLVYDSILKFIGSIATSGKAQDEKLYDFHLATKPAKFLLGDDIGQFINNIYNKAIDLQTIDAELEGVPRGEERTRMVRERGEIKKWIYSQFDELDNKFGHILGLDNEPTLYKRLTMRLSGTRKKRRAP